MFIGSGVRFSRGSFRKDGQSSNGDRVYRARTSSTTGRGGEGTETGGWGKEWDGRGPANKQSHTEYLLITLCSWAEGLEGLRSVPIV